MNAFLGEQEKAFLTNFNIPFPYNRPPSDWISSDPEKILVLSDLHEPYGSEMVLEEAKARHKDAGTLVIPGDLGDYYSKSRFRKQRHVSFKDEVRAIFFRLEWLATNWPTVKVMLGSHDNRPEKAIMSVLGDTTDLLVMTEQNLLKHLASYFDNIEVVDLQIPDKGIGLTHIYQFGDIVFTHGEISRVQKTATLDKVSKYLHDWSAFLGLKPFKVIAQAHNHQDLKTSEGGEFWFMLPTASDPYSLGFEYILSAKMWGKPPKVGYSIFRQSKGETDYNQSHNVVLRYEP